MMLDLEFLPIGMMPLASGAAVVLFIIWISFAEARRASTSETFGRRK